MKLTWKELYFPPINLYSLPHQMTNRRNNMELLARIKVDLLTSRIEAKGKSCLKVDLLRTFVGEAEQIIKSPNVYSTDALVKKYVKNLKFTLDQKYTDSAHTELCIISEYLPEQLTDAELTSIIAASGLNNLGQIMGFLNKEYSGKYDGKQASIIAKENLLISRLP